MRSGAGAAAWNMALDESLLCEATRIGMPVLRFYSWTESAATFGYFQRYDEIAQSSELRPLIRRCTGGGFVSHDRDWTYSLVFPRAHEWCGLRAEESYRRMHEWLAASFTLLGQSVRLAECCSKESRGRCFTGYEKFDVLLGDHKIAGAAQRRNRAGLMIQGSIQPPPDVERAEWVGQVMAHGCAAMGIDWQEWEGDEETLSAARCLEAQKYGTSDYNHKR